MFNKIGIMLKLIIHLRLKDKNFNFCIVGIIYGETLNVINILVLLLQQSRIGYYECDKARALKRLA